MVRPPYSPPLPSSSSAMEYSSEMYQGWDARDYFRILLKRKWVVIGTFLTIFLSGALYTFTRTPIYRATANLQITQDNPGSQVSMDDKLSRLSGTDEPEKFQQTQYKILQSWSMAQRVAQALNLANYPNFKALKEQNPEKSESELEDTLVSYILGGLEVVPVRGSYLVDVSFVSPDKALAQRVVNAIAAEYIYLSIDRRNESFELVRKWLDKQLQEMGTKVQEAQKKLYKFGQKTDIYTLEDKDNVIVQKFIDLSSLLTKAQAEKMAREAQHQQIKERGPDAPLIVNNQLITGLRQLLVTQEAKVSALKKVYRGGHPDLQVEQANLDELQRRMRAEIQRMQESVKADYEAANRTEKLLSDSFLAQKGQMVKLQDHLSDFQILKRDAQTNEQLYQALLARVKEANISSTMVPANVAVIDKAQLPMRPFKPNNSRNLGLAMVLGLGLGVGLALMLEYTDYSIKSIDDMERACNMPSLGVLPLLGSMSVASHRKKFNLSETWRYLSRFPRGGRSNVEDANMDLVVSEHPKSHASEAVLHVYSSLMLSTSGKPPCVIMVTSPNPTEGKTMVVSNLGLTSALNGRPVVLVDCDLRKPRLHKIFGVNSQPGLTNYLTGSATLEEILLPTGIPNLTIITAGTKPPSPTNLLNSEIFKELLTQLRQQFLHVIIDTPPVLGFADARFVSILVDGVLLVIKQNFTHKSAGNLAHQLLNQAPALGALLNFVGPHGQPYGNYYYYYNYKYYSKYYGDKEK